VNTGDANHHRRSWSDWGCGSLVEPAAIFVRKWNYVGKRLNIPLRCDCGTCSHPELSTGYKPFSVKGTNHGQIWFTIFT